MRTRCCRTPRSASCMTNTARRVRAVPACETACVGLRLTSVHTGLSEGPAGSANDFFQSMFGGGLFGGMGGGQRERRSKDVVHQLKVRARHSDTQTQTHTPALPSRRARGAALTSTCTGQVSLNDMYKGKTSKLALSKQVLCPTCNGVGGKKGAAKCVTLCGPRSVRSLTAGWWGAAGRAARATATASPSSCVRWVLAWCSRSRRSAPSAAATARR